MLVSQQKKSIRHLINSKYNSHTDPLFKSLNYLKLTDQIYLDRVVFMHKYRYQTLPISFNSYYTFLNDSSEARLRSADDNFLIPHSNSKNLIKYPHIESVLAWNSLPND